VNNEQTFISRAVVDWKCGTKAPREWSLKKRRTHLSSILSYCIVLYSVIIILSLLYIAVQGDLKQKSQHENRDISQKCINILHQISSINLGLNLFSSLTQ